MSSAQTTEVINTQINEADVDTNKIYCANCANCKLIRSNTGSGSQYCLRVRCAAGMWRKKLGEEKVYKYFTVARRSPDSCEFYEPMGNPKDFIKDLKKTLPIKDEVYTGSN
ncbi:MAG: hypothetical protein PQJ46_00145 [Spirochaetales bacterium]|nr:hypothetical protein [Spirochaetales bacterium]